MKNLMFLAVILITSLSACSKIESSQPRVAIASTSVQLDLDTPDKALKSYWAVRDSIRAKKHELYINTRSDFESIEKQIGDVAEGEIARNFSFSISPFETFTRDLIDVKVESESRAVIVVVIKNSTPIPAGGEMSTYTEKSRRDGDRYRYILERGQSGWRVSEIWEWSTYQPANDWKKKWPDDGKPYVASLTYEGV